MAVNQGQHWLDGISFLKSGVRRAWLSFPRRSRMLTSASGSLAATWGPTVTPNKVNLYIDGSDFYRGSTRKDLKNGWCDFRVLGNILVKRHFGSSFDVGKIWYVTNVDAPEIRYGEQQRKKLWLNAL